MPENTDTRAAWQDIKTAKTFEFSHRMDRINLQAYWIGGNSGPHFSVTVDSWERNERGRMVESSCGCQHDIAAKRMPRIKPLIALHLSDCLTGEPMHAEANGFYWLAGACPEINHCGEEYHGGGKKGDYDEKGPDECVRILSEHLRITYTEATEIKNTVAAFWDNKLSDKANNARCKFEFAGVVDAMRPRWKAEAEAGMELLRSIAAEQSK